MPVSVNKKSSFSKKWYSMLWCVCTVCCYDMICNLTDEGMHKWCAVDVPLFSLALALAGTHGPVCRVLAFPWHSMWRYCGLTSNIDCSLTQVLTTAVVDERDRQSSYNITSSK